MRPWKYNHSLVFTAVTSDRDWGRWLVNVHVHVKKAWRSIEQRENTHITVITVVPCSRKSHALKCIILNGIDQYYYKISVVLFGKTLSQQTIMFFLLKSQGCYHLIHEFSRKKLRISSWWSWCQCFEIDWSKCKFFSMHKMISRITQCQHANTVYSGSVGGSGGGGGGGD